MKTLRGLRLELREDVSWYAPNLQNGGFVVLRTADGCLQSYDDAKAKVSVGQVPQSNGCWRE